MEKKENRKEEMLAYLLRELRVREVVFSYKKKDGTLRTVVGTLRPDLTPPLKGGVGHRRSLAVCAYWDVDLRAWRCFRKASLVAVDHFCPDI